MKVTIQFLNNTQHTAVTPFITWGATRKTYLMHGRSKSTSTSFPEVCHNYTFFFQSSPQGSIRFLYLCFPPNRFGFSLTSVKRTRSWLELFKASLSLSERQEEYKSTQLFEILLQVSTLGLRLITNTKHLFNWPWAADSPWTHQIPAWVWEEIHSIQGWSFWRVLTAKSIVTIIKDL